MKIGNIELKNQLIAAPMAGISDRPFRSLCEQYGAAMTVSEMQSSNPDVWRTDKSLLRMVHRDEPGIRAVQIVGHDPKEMAEAACINVKYGAQLIDINMGCPAKKVNKKLAGSALLQYPQLIEQILYTVANAVDVPVTLKIRTGWDLEHKNCVDIAKIAEQCGIQAITIHGRTRACLFNGDAEYDSIRLVKQNVAIPVIANGDISDPKKAQFVLNYTGADALMIGRAAQGRPWIFKEIQAYLETGTLQPAVSIIQMRNLIIEHVKTLHQFYGEYKGLRIARKHVSWYLSEHMDIQSFRRSFNAIDNAQQQLETLEEYLEFISLNII